MAAKLSEPQELLVRKMNTGAKLRHHQDTGLFRLQDAITTRTVHPATVESLLRSTVDAAWLLRTSKFEADLRTMIDDDIAYWETMSTETCSDGSIWTTG